VRETALPQIDAVDFLVGCPVTLLLQPPPPTCFFYERTTVRSERKLDHCLTL
jgi:hypothetical protein